MRKREDGVRNGNLVRTKKRKSIKKSTSGKKLDFGLTGGQPGPGMRQYANSVDNFDRKRESVMSKC